MDPISIFVIIALIFSIVIHEAAHGYAANALGDPTARLQGRLTLNPISHIDPLGSVLIPGILVLTGAPFLFGWAKPVPYNPYNLKNARWGEAMVAAAGPGVNILIALIFGLLVRFSDFITFLPTEFFILALQVVMVNVLLALFNLIPIPPLDGSKVIKALLPARLAFSYERFEAAMLNLGLLATFLFIFIFIQVFSAPFSEGVRAVVRVITGV